MIAVLALLLVAAPQGDRDSGTTVLRAATVLDGRGGVQRRVDIIIVGNRIARIVPRGPVPAGARLIDLGARTVLPGLIDAHTHPVWYFNQQDRLHTAGDGDTPAQSTLAAAANVYATLLAGFTTIQSVGAQRDADLRDAIATRAVPGPPPRTSPYRPYRPNPRARSPAPRGAP